MMVLTKPIQKCYYCKKALSDEEAKVGVCDTCNKTIPKMLQAALMDEESKKAIKSILEKRVLKDKPSQEL
jgi:hypothetical protein